jgi:hypothetical protein
MTHSSGLTPWRLGQSHRQHSRSNVVFGSFGPAATAVQFPCHPRDIVYDPCWETVVGTNERLWKQMYSLMLLPMCIYKCPPVYLGFSLQMTMCISHLWCVGHCPLSCVCVCVCIYNLQDVSEVLRSRLRVIGCYADICIYSLFYAGLLIAAVWIEPDTLWIQTLA